MRDEPAQLSCDVVAGWLRQHWALAPVEVSYAPVGFGGYHWVAVDEHGDRWFVTVNHLDPHGNWLGPAPDAAFATLTAAAGATRALSEQGCRFAVAPVPDRAGVLVRRMLPGWAMQVFAYLEGWSTTGGSWHCHVRMGYFGGERTGRFGNASGHRPTNPSVGQAGSGVRLLCSSPRRSVVAFTAVVVIRVARD